MTDNETESVRETPNLQYQCVIFRAPPMGQARVVTPGPGWWLHTVRELPKMTEKLKSNNKLVSFVPVMFVFARDVPPGEELARGVTGPLPGEPAPGEADLLGQVKTE